MSDPIHSLKKHVKESKSSSKRLKKRLSKHKKELIKENELSKTMKRVNSGAKNIERQTIRRLIRLTEQLIGGVSAVQSRMKKQELLIEKAEDDVNRQETYLLKEVKRLHGLLSTRQNSSESSMYIFGQREIGGINDSPFNI